MKKFLRSNLDLLVFMLCLFVVRSAVADWYQVPSGSMQPTIEIGDRVLVDNRAYNVRIPFTDIHIAERAVPVRGDIITCKSPVDGIRLIKRVVGVAGDRIEAHDGTLYVNGQAAPGHAGHIPFGPVEVPADHVFVMGDNRDNSFDSRYWGPLPVANVYGRAMKVVLSLDGIRPRGDRWWKSLADQAP